MNTYIQEGIAAKLIAFDEEMKTITYLHQNKKRSFTNPEEQVQAETFCRLVLQYGYPAEHIRQFVTVKMGVSDKEADIVVYKDDMHHQPYIIVECKKAEISELEFQEAEKQALSYAHALAGTTKYIWVTKGNKDTFSVFDKDKNKGEEIADIPYFGEDKPKEFRFAKGGYYKDKIQGKEVQVMVNDLQKVDESELTRIFKQAHDALWAGGELNPSQAFDELNKLIFCKIWDEKYSKKGQPYVFQVISDDSNALKEKIVALYKNGQNKNKEVFDKPIDLSAQRIESIVKYFQKVSLLETDLDSKGKAFETFLGSYFRGNFGQFFTPRNVIQLVIDVLPMTNEHRVLDTSCGSGGFLLYALDKVRKQATADFPDYENDRRDYEDWKRHWHDFAEKNLFGIEINDQISRVAKMNMIIHDDGHTNVVCHDGLFEPEVIVKNTENKGFEANSFDFIITNPPFGSIIKQSEKGYMQITEGTAPAYRFALKEVNWIDKELKPKNALTGRENQSTEILFIEQCYKFLKPQGYLAVVIPDGILTNSSLQYVRNHLEKMFRIVAVVSLPQTAFTHTGAGVKSSVLFLKKYSVEQTEKLEQLQAKLINHLAQQKQIAQTIAKWEQQKKDELKPLAKDKSEQGEKQRKEISEKYNDKIGAFREQLESDLQAAKQSQFPDYPIFMAIAEYIGYDATGKNIAQNDLPEITQELKRFIEAIEAGNDSFFQ